MPSSTAALGFPQEERNILGGWQAQASDRYARVAKLSVRNMQKAVVQTIQKNDRDDPFGEAETFTHLDEFMAQKSHPPEARAKLISALEKWEVRALMPAEDLEREAVAPEDEEVRAVTEFDEQAWGHTGTEETGTTERPLKKKRGGHAQIKTECLGENPKGQKSRYSQYLAAWLLHLPVREAPNQDSSQTGGLLRFAGRGLLGVRLLWHHSPGHRRVRHCVQTLRT